MQEKAKGWDIKEIEYLEKEIENCINENMPLSTAFKKTSEFTKRNPNSIRNFYYTYLRKQMIGNDNDKIKRREKMDFDAFTDGEIHHLVKYIIMGTSSGKSIRQCANEMADGNTKLILRYQNKYRSIIKRHQDVIDKILDELSDEGFEYVSPYKKEHTKCEKAHHLLRSEIDLSGFIKQVNVLFDNCVIDGNIRKNLIYTKAMAEGEYNKIQKSKMLYEFYTEKLHKLMDENIQIEDNSKQ